MAYNDTWGVIRKYEIEEAKIGDVFFVDLAYLNCWDIDDNDEVTYVGYPEETLPNVLIAVKYLGNYVGEEMLTGEKIHFVNPDFTLEDDEGEYQDYSIPVYPEKGKEKVYFDDASDFIKDSSECPLVLLLDENTFEINDETKRKYLEVDNRVRESTIEKIKRFGESKLTRLHGILKSECKKILNLSGEVVDMAYLENELFDFSEGRIR